MPVYFQIVLLSEEDLKTYLIVAVAVGGGLILILVIVIIVMACHMKKNT